MGLASCKLRIERRGQCDSKGKRQHDADIANKHNRGPLFQDSLEINLKADHKHEK